MGRRLGVSAIAVVAAIAAAVMGSRLVDQRRFEQARAEAERAAGLAREKVADAVRLAANGVEIRASAAATLPPLIATLTLLRENKLEGAVATTLTDWFEAEPPWEPFRREFKVYGLAIESDSLDFVHGAKESEFASALLVRQARDRGVASEIVIGNGWPYAAAAARVVVPTLSKPVVLVLATPVDESTLKEAADRAGGAIILSNGNEILAKSGAATELASLSSVVGKESAGVHSHPGGDWAAAAFPVAPRLWLWVHANAVSSARAAQASATTTKAVIWSSALGVVLVALYFGLRRTPAAAGVVTTDPSLVIPVSTIPGVAGTRIHPSSSPGGAPPISGFGATIAAPAGAPPPTSSRAFGRYLLLDKLGEGGMSQVFTAVIFGAEGFKRKFVVKRLRPELAHDAKVVAQFTDEANLASTLVHSNIVPVFDFGKVDDEYFLATEYILGRDLGRVVGRTIEVDRRPLAPDVVFFCARETLKALEYAHTRRGEDGQPLSIVHRDVSPGNVLVSMRGEVKLFDFGIVKAEGRVTKTEQGVVKGNVSFMSPEQARGLETDARSDLFSLGLVMFYCLTGDVLYHGATTYELLLKAATGPGPAEKARIAALPPPAAAVVARALEVDPNQRYSSAAAFAAAIAPLLRATEIDLAALVQRLFGEEFHTEERRFAAAVPGALAASQPFSQTGGLGRSENR